MVLTNAVAFRGSWLGEFDPADTADDTFHVSPTESVPVRMMNRRGQIRLRQENGFRVVRLPYQGGAKSMLVAVPEAIDGLAAIEAELTAPQVARWPRAGERDVILQLPKFRVVGKSDLTGALKALGMPRAFADGEADFSGITEREALHLGAVVHEAVVEVDEQGTVAVASTAVQALYFCVPEPPQVYTVRADRPFLFVIVDDATDAILFVGRVDSV